MRRRSRQQESAPCPDNRIERTVREKRALLGFPKGSNGQREVIRHHFKVISEFVRFGKGSLAVMGEHMEPKICDYSLLSLRTRKEMLTTRKY